jgi:membrane protein DedA with SNARE-associated domain
MVILQLLHPIVNAITGIIFSLGYPGIFGLMVLESALVPIPSEIIMPFSGFLVSDGKLSFVPTILAGSIGNLVGSILTYFLGLRVGRQAIIRYGKYVLLREKHLQVTERWFGKYGDITSFIGRLLPGVRTYISLPAGAGQMRFGRFVLFSFIGSCIWNSGLTLFGMQLGNNWESIDKYSTYLDIAAAIAVVGFVIWFARSSRKANKLEA